jgi:non-specific protein-tyrosine kinase
MELNEIINVFRKRLWIIVLGTLLVSASAFIVGRNMTPIYEAKVMMKVDQPSNAPVSFSSISTGENLALTYSKLLRTRPVLEIAIANLGVNLSPDQLKRILGTKLVPETQLLELTVQDPDPQRASDIVNEIAFTFISLHNSEQGLQNITALEQDVVAQMALLKQLIENNQSSLDRLRSSRGVLMEEEPNRIENALSSQQSTYAGLLTAYLNVRRTQSQFFDVSVVEPAVVPMEPIKPNIPLYTFLGVFLGLLLGVGLAFLVELLDNTIETRDDVRQSLAVPTLSSIPRFQSEERTSPLIASTLPGSPVSESFRTLRTNLRFASVGEPLKTLLITSAEPGAGKTSIAANLGVVCAQAGLQVVLIDADLRRPALHRPFDLRSSPGLTDLLVKDIHNVEDFLLSTGTRNLRLIGSGTSPFNPAELLGSQGMRELLAELSENADLVIVDTSPTLAVTDAAVLASEVDGVLLVVAARKTRQEAAQHALESLQRVGANVLGVVLNAVPARRGSYYYQYGSHGEGRGRGKLRLPQPKVRMPDLRMPNLRMLFGRER